jgi:hypothetical protein
LSTDESERRSFDASPFGGTQLRITLPKSKMRTDTQGDLLVPEEE